MNEHKLYMVLAGCRPAGRNTEQHDVFFGIGKNIQDVLPDLFNFWPEVKKKIHLDAWREVTQVPGYAISIVPKDLLNTSVVNDSKLFFINLGGYKQGEFEEFHYKMIVAATHKDMAIQQAKQSAFYRHTGFTTAPAHIDDKFGIDVDDISEIKDILPTGIKNKYHLVITTCTNTHQDTLHLGYIPVSKL